MISWDGKKSDYEYDENAFIFSLDLMAKFNVEDPKKAIF